MIESLAVPLGWTRASEGRLRSLVTECLSISNVTQFEAGALRRSLIPGAGQLCEARV